MVPILRTNLFAALILLGSTAQAGTNLAGKWEVQSMGADRSVSMQQKGNRITAHRVLWPEFEGERYKLEHLYRGRIQGAKIRGQLLVREEELPDFEVLREFVGSIDSNAKITLDGLPMKRISNEVPKSPDTPKGPKGRAPEMPGFGSLDRSPAPASATELYAILPKRRGSSNALMLISTVDS